MKGVTSISLSKREREEEQQQQQQPQSQSQSSQLVGSVVEKGFSTENKTFPSTPLPLPRPSVLPFPVARHRSHGPHWVPLTSSNKMDIDNDDNGDDDDDDDDDDTHFSSFANPIQRKQKKTLNFSNWKELVSQDTTVITNKRAEGGKQLQGVVIENVDIEVRERVVEVENVEKLHVGYEGNGRDNMLVDDLMRGLNIKHESSEPRDERGSMSLESQIDAENRAQLQKMSADEIVEEQSEILEKMKPGVIEMLKRRGRNKLGSKLKSSTSCSESDSRLATQMNENLLKQDLKSDPLSAELNAEQGSALRPSSHTSDAPNTGGVKKLGVPNKKWNAWSERVEAVRALRFSLDGTVLGSVPLQSSDQGNNANNSRSIDGVTERDFLRTEGDPGGVGYTIKEAVSLSRSMVPGQRSLALQLLASVLDKALWGIQQIQVGCDVNIADNFDKFVDWEAVWAFTLGPEPELALSLRMALDDNHISVVFTTVKVLHSVLSCDMNESFFDTSEKMSTFQNVMCTAPVFRSRPGIDVGFLHGGFWKYNTKPSNILPITDETGASENEGNHTIRDDVIVAGQDFAAGLIRMGIIPRIHYLLVADPSAALEEHLISIIIGLARHSQMCANAIIRFPGLVEIIVDRFLMKDTVEVNPSKIKSTTLVKVLAQYDRKICIHFIEKGIVRNMMWHFYRQPLSLEQWIKSGREYFKLMSALMIEQLRLWKVCIQYGYCISYFADFFPVLCLWLTPPDFDNLIENNVLGEFAAISREAYLVLEALARRLPNLHSMEQLSQKTSGSDDMEMWSWSHVGPMVESALKWISTENNAFLPKIVNCNERTTLADQESSVSSIVWVISAVEHMLSSVLNKVAPGSHNNLQGRGDCVPWLPEFVPKIGIEVIKNRFLDFSGTDDMAPSGRGSLAKALCHLRLHSHYALSLSSVSCLHGLVQLIVSLDKCVQIAKQESYTPSSGQHSFLREGKILEDGIFVWSQGELRSVLVTFMNLVSSSWRDIQCIETFGRGGPAPGVGLGWGASGGGFWSVTVLLRQADSQLLMDLVEMFEVVFEKDDPTVEDVTFILQRVDTILGVCLIAGPGDTLNVEKALDFLLQTSVLKYLGYCVRRFLRAREIKAFGWEYKEDNYLYMSEILKFHFKNRWLCKKRKSESVDSHPDTDRKTVKKGGNALDTIYEDSDTVEPTVCDPHCTSMVTKWAHQRLPLPMHWFLSPISTINDSKGALAALNAPDKVLEVAKSGLFFLLGLEAMNSSPCTSVNCSPVHVVPLIWKLHSLSVVLLVGMGVLQEEKSRDLYRTLQDLYAQLLDESRCRRITKVFPDKNDDTLPETGRECGVEFLKFQSDVHETYTTFIDTLVEQFGAASYGDVIYGRQISMYLHHSVEAPVRLATWNALSNAHILELLPPLGECFAGTEGYLDIEDNEGILEAYVKSWVSGGLDKAALRGSMTFTLALHHLSSFIFYNDADDKLLLRNKLAKSLLRDCSRKQKHEGMMLDFIPYNKPATSQEHERKESTLAPKSEIERRFRLLAEACEGNSTLLAVIEKLKSSSILL